MFFVSRICPVKFSQGSPREIVIAPIIPTFISQGRAFPSQPASPGTFSENDLRAKVVLTDDVGAC